jgi:hypothetical protein
MKKMSLFFVILTLEIFTFQNVYSEDFFLKNIQSRTFEPYTRRVVLWRIYTEPFDSNAKMLVSVDSVLREDYHSEEKFLIQGKEEKLHEIKPNTYYLVLTLAGYNYWDDAKVKFFIFFPGKDYILPDTPENRVLLSKKFDGLKIKYEKERPRIIKGREIDM